MLVSPELPGAAGRLMDPDTVRNQRFLLVRRGYDPEAVEEFLDDVATALEELRVAAEVDAPGPRALEVADARRAVDEARTSAATHRLRAQRDVEALERAARQRRARLLAEIEELAAARDQLSTDLDRAVDVVDRVVQWVRRTDPGATATPGPDAVGGATPSVTPAPDEPAPDEPVAEESDHGGIDTSHDEEVDAPDDGAVDTPADDGEDPDAVPGDEPGSPEVVAAALPDDDAVLVGDEPGVAAVRDALRVVQDEVLANLREHPRGDVTDWLPSATGLEGLDDAATDAAGDAFLTGWEFAATPDAEEPDDDHAIARDALEEVRGAGDLPGLDVAADLEVALAASLARGRGAGDPEVGLRERVAEVHRDLRQTRLPEALEAVLVAARHHGQLARWRRDGVEAVAWVVGRERRCPGRRCRGNAADGVVAPGAAFAFGDVVPPAHPGCTCTLRPAGRDEASA